jgi:hypothetical protein
MDEVMKINISDREFEHDICSVAGQTPKHIEWVRDGSGNPDWHFFTNKFIFGDLGKARNRVAWLIEPENIAPEVMDKFHDVAYDFDLILTHSSKILNKYKRARWIFGNGSWVGGRLPTGGGEEKIYSKTKCCSIVSSIKSMVPLHQFRIDIARRLMFSSDSIALTTDVFGDVAGNYLPIIDCLADYRYHIAIENFVDDLYWTEKVTNCFLTGTIPIYLGARKLDTIYNPYGFLTFKTEDELWEILRHIQSAGEEFYNARLSSIQENFEIAKQYRVMEDYIYDQFISGVRSI